MPELKDGWVSITYPGKKANVVKHGSKAHVNAMQTKRNDGRPKVVKLANKGQVLSAKEREARGIPAATKAQAKSEDKAQAKDGDK